MYTIIRSTSHIMFVSYTTLLVGYLADVHEAIDLVTYYGTITAKSRPCSQVVREQIG
jgi:hypothetical protein